MSRLTTVATFDLVAKAEVAKNVLEEAGIPAVITDAEIVAMDWLISNAVGGIKVQVRVEDAERAAEVLDGQFGAESGLAAEGIDMDELTRQALAAGGPDEDDVPTSDSPRAAVRTKSRRTGPAPIDREGYAFRAFIIAWWGLVIWPLAFYALYLFLNAAFGEGPLSRLGRFRIVVAAFLLLCALTMSAVIISGFTSPFGR